MEIVSYTSADKHHVATFFREIFQEMGWEERESDYMDQPEKLFHLPYNGLLLLVKENGKIIGTAGVTFLNTTDGLLKRFYIEKSYRGLGLAQQLLEEVYKKSKLAGIKKLILDVSKKNTRAIRFYQKNGFLPTTVTPQNDWPESNAPEKHWYFSKNLN